MKLNKRVRYSRRPRLSDTRYLAVGNAREMDICTPRPSATKRRLLKLLI